jgi:pimeloyl-ACP methyl ester carboxylesterase
MKRIVAQAQDGLSIVASLYDSPQPSTPTVLLHGLSQQRDYWLPTIRRLRVGPVMAVDQRGHGDSDADVTADFSVATCASDIAALIDTMGWSKVVIVGHSWGAAVALAFASAFPTRTTAAILIDGGLWGPRDLGDHGSTRERLRPPALGIPEDDLWILIREGDLGPLWTKELHEALTPTFSRDEHGLVRTRIGMDRHMAVLDGLFEFAPQPHLELTHRHATPLWVITAEPRPTNAEGESGSWESARSAGLAAVMSRPHVTTLRMMGAIHDVPLQWPSVIAGIVDQVVLTGDRS